MAPSLIRGLLTAPALAGSILWFAALPAAEPVKQSATKGSPTASTAAPAANAPAAASKKASPYTAGMPASARTYYALTWGVDLLSVQLTKADQLVRFSYRVMDVVKAAPLHDKASSPQLLDEKAHAVLQVPNMEKVGPLRQATPPEVGKSYWMVFSNKGNHVKAGHRVSVVIGQFRVDGLVVQ